jgi:hypothetical protein
VIEPLRIAHEVACSAEHAFDTWTSRFGTWWPRSHSASGEADTEVVLEPRVGGRIYEVTSDGREIDWGWITHWEPPRRLGYRWHIRRDRADATDVEIRFVPHTGSSARIEITHTGWERLGADGSRWRDANAAGWSGLLPHFLAACAAPTPTRQGETP